MNEVIVLFDGYSKPLSDDRMDANCTCTLVKGQKNVIVDTMTAWDRDRLIEGLGKHDLHPDDIDYVVCTHSHSDHIGNNNLFLQAEHIVGHSVQQGTMFYEKGIKDDKTECERNGSEKWKVSRTYINCSLKLPNPCYNMKTQCFVLTIDDYELCDGVRVTATPGHTYEDVTVLVENGKGSSNVVKYAITGDLFEKEEDILDPSIWRELGIPELRQVQASSRLRILKFADYIIPGHGPMFKTNSTLIELLENQIHMENDS